MPEYLKNQQARDEDAAQFRRPATGLSPLPGRVARRADDGEGVLYIIQNGAGDIALGITLRRRDRYGGIGAGVTFAPYQGGGRSPKVRAALIQLAHAIKEQNDEDSHGAG